VRQVEVVCHLSELGRWESAVAAAHPALRPDVREYVGGIEQTAHALCRRALPTEMAPIIFNFGAPFRIFNDSERLAPSTAPAADRTVAVSPCNNR